MNIIQKKKQDNINTFTKETGETTDPGEETLDALIKAHFPNAVEKLRKSYNSGNKLTKLEIQETNKEWINYSLTKEALMSFGNKKAAGPDKINPSYSTTYPTTSSGTWCSFLNVLSS